MIKFKGVEPGKFEFRKSGTRLALKTWFGVVLQQEGIDIQVEVPGRFLNKLRGVCGNNNDEKTDDYTRCDTGEVLEYRENTEDERIDSEWETAKPRDSKLFLI